MMRWLILVTLFWVQLTVSARPLSANDRVALVIGNAKYANAPELINPTHDATDMSVTLKGLGFHVVEGLDLDKRGFELKVREFSDALSGATIGAFFYAGHGLQVGGVNYLLPIDARLSSSASLDFEMIRLDLLQQTIERSTKTTLMFIDACRDNPLTRSLAGSLGTRSGEIGRGLAAMEPLKGSGTLISYSTAPGSVAVDGTGRNSPYAESLARRLSKESTHLQELLIDVQDDVLRATIQKQRPWYNSGLNSRVYLKPRGLNVAPPDVASAAAQQSMDEAVISVSLAKTIDRTISKDCGICPEMVAIPAGRSAFGSSLTDAGRATDEAPELTEQSKPFAVGKGPVTIAEYQACVLDKACSPKSTEQVKNSPSDASITFVSWSDAISYVVWLSRKTGKSYRLPTEREREYFARAGTTTPYWWGSTFDDVKSRRNSDASARGPRALSYYQENPFGLLATTGAVLEWTSDCWQPLDRLAQLVSMLTKSTCPIRVVRGASWRSRDPRAFRSAWRNGAKSSARSDAIGFRVVRD
jgi:formylglycine-generating enzyme required for sulfatase activity